MSWVIYSRGDDVWMVMCWVCHGVGMTEGWVTFVHADELGADLVCEIEISVEAMAEACNLCRVGALPWSCSGKVSGDGPCGTAA